jgi:hypothetical protein
MALCSNKHQEEALQEGLLLRQALTGNGFKSCSLFRGEQSVVDALVPGPLEDGGVLVERQVGVGQVVHGHQLAPYKHPGFPCLREGAVLELDTHVGEETVVDPSLFRRGDEDALSAAMIDGLPET